MCALGLTQTSKLFSAVPVLYLVGARDVIDVHPDLVGDVWRQAVVGGGGGIRHQEDHARPELPVLDKLQGPVNHLALSRHPLQFVERETLEEEEATMRIMRMMEMSDEGYDAQPHKPRIVTVVQSCYPANIIQG